ncbi:MAG: hypothetical protein ACRENI_11380 [Gemmatimonadaceae bacterium]
MMRARRYALLTVMLPLLSACSASRASTRDVGDRNSTVITTAEMRAADAMNVYDLVRRVRPQWLRDRGPTSMTPSNEGGLVVYLDNARLGGPEALREILPANVMFVQYFDPGSANYRFGTGHHHGAILVSTSAAR